MVLNQKKVAYLLQAAYSQVEEFKYGGSILLHIEKICSGCPQDASQKIRTCPTGKTQVRPRMTPPEDLEDVSREREVWASLLRLLPLCPCSR